MKRFPSYFSVATTACLVSCAASIASYFFYERSVFVLVLGGLVWGTGLLGLYLPLLWKQKASPAWCVFVMSAALFCAVAVVVPPVRLMLIALPPVPDFWFLPWCAAGSGCGVCVLALVRRRTWAESTELVVLSALLLAGGVAIALMFVYLIFGG